jgi:hypothetical protein
VIPSLHHEEPYRSGELPEGGTELIRPSKRITLSLHDQDRDLNASQMCRTDLLGRVGRM